MAGAPVEPLSWVVFKVTQRCNLNCTYCYVYNRGDESWRQRPAFVADAVVDQLGVRIAEHGDRFGLREFVVELHGGEPLLLGPRRFEDLVGRLRRLAAPVDLRIVMQTNGLLLDDRWLEVIDRCEVTFGVSVDGPPGDTDHRIRLNGRGSTNDLVALIGRLRTNPLWSRLNTGALCVIDPTRNGADSVRWFAEMGFRAFDFLLPDGNYANLPQGWTGAEPYRRFLLEALDAWWHMGAAAPRIRTFEVMLLAFAGIRPQLDALGGDLHGLCVVESDGSIGVSDVARICGGDFSKDRLSIFSSPLSEHAAAYRIPQVQALSTTCTSCTFKNQCGGGYLPHRFDGEGFGHPSIYCSALYAVAQEIYSRLRKELPPSMWKEESATHAAAVR